MDISSLSKVPPYFKSFLTPLIFFIYRSLKNFIGGLLKQEINLLEKNHYFHMVQVFFKTLVFENEYKNVKPS